MTLSDLTRMLSDCIGLVYSKIWEELAISDTCGPNFPILSETFINLDISDIWYLEIESILAWNVIQINDITLKTSAAS